MAQHETDEEDREACFDCGGTGIVHECGEDTCACADPATQLMVTCPTCVGTGEGQ